MADRLEVIIPKVNGFPENYEELASFLSRIPIVKEINIAHCVDFYMGSWPVIMSDSCFADHWVLYVWIRYCRFLNETDEDGVECREAIKCFAKYLGVKEIWYLSEYTYTDHYVYLVDECNMEINDLMSISREFDDEFDIKKPYQLIHDTIYES